MRLILTGATGMVGEGVLLTALATKDVEAVTSISRRASGITHPKLTERIVADFRDVSAIEGDLAGFDGCLYCAGITSRGLTEEQYTIVTYETPMRFCETLARLNPSMVLSHVSGASTDSSEKGRIMWARVKGRAENALAKLPFRAVYNFRPGMMKPRTEQKNVLGGYKVIAAIYPVLSLLLPGITLEQLGDAMIAAIRSGAPKTVLEVRDIRALAAS